MRSEVLLIAAWIVVLVIIGVIQKRWPSTDKYLSWRRIIPAMTLFAFGILIYFLLSR